MKHILIITIVAVMCLQQAVFAESEQQKSNIEPKQKITFVYIHGSNDFGGEKRAKFKEHFKKQVHDMHPYMTKAFNKDKLIHHTLLKDGEIEINPEPVIFYWGDKSLTEVQELDNDLDLTKGFSPRISQMVRSTFAHCLHDAVWVQKYQNMSIIIDELQEVVKTESDKGNQVILFGYSAGSFITYEYFLNKFISLVPSELEFKITNPAVREMIKVHPVQKTCLDALMESDILRLDLYGRYTTNKDLDTVIRQYPQLDAYTNIACFSDDTVKGVVNFASPLALFYSELKDSKSDLNFLSKLMYKHILESDIFWLTVNYREDPLGFPASKNVTKEQLNAITGGNLKSNGGFVYDKSDVKSGRSFLSAHLAYWDTQKRFVKGVVKAYNDGYNNLYKNLLDDSDSQEKL